MAAIGCKRRSYSWNLALGLRRQELLIRDVTQDELYRIKDKKKKKPTWCRRLYKEVLRIPNQPAQVKSQTWVSWWLNYWLWATAVNIEFKALLSSVSLKYRVPPGSTGPWADIPNNSQAEVTQKNKNVRKGWCAERCRRQWIESAECGWCALFVSRMLGCALGSHWFITLWNVLAL